MQQQHNASSFQAFLFMTASVCLSQQPDREKVDLVCVLFPSYSHSPCLGFNWLLFSLLSLSCSPLLRFYLHSFPFSLHLSFSPQLFLSVRPSVVVSLSFLLQRHRVCAGAWHGWHASIWKCSGDDIEHMWPRLAGWGLCGDHTVSLVVVRTPALQCKGRREKDKDRYNQVKEGERVKKENKDKRWC